MADSKISGLTSATTPLAGTEVLPIVQSGVTKQVSVANLTAGRSVDASTLTVTGNTYLATTSGILGVGVSSNTSRGGGLTSGLFYKSSGTHYVDIQTGSSGTSGLLFSTASTGDYGAIQYNNSSGDLQFYTTSSERLRITSAGNVGIGTSSPGAKLDVATTTGFTFNTTSTAGVQIGTQGTSGGSLMVQTASLNSSYGSGLAIDGAYSSQKSTINIKAFGVYSGGGYGSNLAFHTSSDATLNERMRIDSSGNVGIGTSSPGAKLDVSGTLNTTSYWSLTGSPGGAGGAVRYIGAGGTSNMWYHNVPTGGSFRWAINESGIMALDSSGNLGIGTTSPDAKLRVNGTAKVGEGAASNTSKLMVNTVSGVAAGIQLFQDANESWIIQNPASTTALTFGNSGTERMRIDASGNVGIGTSSPNRKMEVLSTTAIPMRVGTTDSNMAIEYFSTLGTRFNWLVGAQYNVSGGFEITPSTAAGGTTYSTPAVTVLSNGNIGIGTTSPAVPLEVIGQTTVDGAATGAATGTFLIKGAKSDSQGFKFTFNNSTNLADITNFYSGALTFGTNNTERMRIDTSGNLGLGVTPSAWGSGYKAFQTTGTTLGSNSTNGTYYTHNAYFDGTNWVYIANANAGRYQMLSGEHSWHTASSGTAGATISFTQAMTLTGGGNLGIGTTSPGYKFDVSGTGRFTGAVEIRSGANAYNTLADTTTTANSGYYAAYNASGTRQGYMGYWDASGYSIAAESGNALLLWTGGSERVRITSTGNVGVGTSSPSFRLTANYTAPATFTNAASDFLQMWQASGTNALGFAANTTGTVARLVLNNGYNFAINYASSELMRVDTAGNVGIGTSSPGALLHLNSAAAGGDVPRMRFTNAGTGTGATDGAFVGIANTSQLDVWNFESDAIRFGTNNAVRMQIDASGNLGLGVTPSAWFANWKVFELGSGSVVFPNNGSTFILTQNAIVPSGTGLWTYKNAGAASRYDQDTGAHKWFNAPSGTAGNTISFTQAMTLDASGNLGVGTTSPSERLHVVGNSYFNGANLTFQSTSNGRVVFGQNNSVGLLRLANNSGTPSIELFNAGDNRLVGVSNSDFSFYTNNTEKMRITSTGELLVGRTSASIAIIDAQSDANGIIRVRGGTASNQGSAFFGTSGSDTTRFAFGQVSRILGGTPNDDAVVYSAGYLAFAPGGSEKARITSTGNLLVGTTTATGARIDSQGDVAGAFEVFSGQNASLNSAAITRLTLGSQGGNWYIENQRTGAPLCFNNGTERLRITSAGNIHTPAGSTTMTNGFIYIPSAGGTPTGAATAITGTVPLYYNSSSNTLYAYNSSWQTISGSLSLLSTNANGVVYLNGSSQATTSANLIFDSSYGGFDVKTGYIYSSNASTTGSALVSATAATAVATSINQFGTAATGTTDGVSNAGLGRLQFTSTTALISVSGAVPLLFSTNGTERMRITSTGTVGIGTSTTSGAGLDVKNDAGGALIYAYGDTATAGSISILARNTDAGAGSYTQFALWNDQNPFSGYAAAIQYYSNASTTPNEFRITQVTNAPMTFYTNNTERMRITAGGELCIGATATVSSSRVYIKATGTSSAAYAFLIEDSASTGLFGVRNDGAFSTGIGSLSPYNRTTASAANVFVDLSGFLFRSTSSAKYKTDIQNATHGLAELLTLRPVTFKSKGGGDTVYAGLIAEEVHEAGLTEFVEYNANGEPDAVYYSNMVALLTKAIQEQQAIIQSLTARIAALESAN